MNLFPTMEPDVARMELARSHMQVAIAQANQAVDRRLAENRARAQKIAAILRTLSDVAEEVLANQHPEIVSDATLPLHYRAAECVALVARPFEEMVEKFLSEHGDLVEHRVVAILKTFVEWAENLPHVLRPKFQEYVEAYERGLRDASAAEEETAAEWSGTDLDGLDNDAAESARPA